MAEAQFQNFDQRVRHIVKKHRKLANGAVHTVHDNGIILPRPKRQIPSISWNGFAFLLIAMMLFKAFLFQSLGEATYMDRVAKLENGTIVEQAGAYVMQPEPVTRFLVAQYSALIGE